MYSSNQPCSSLICGCVSGQLPCTLFCKCGGSDSCCNQMTKNNMTNDANGDEEHSDLKIMEMRMMISYTMNSNALLFTINILNRQLL